MPSLHALHNQCAAGKVDCAGQCIDPVQQCCPAKPGVGGSRTCGLLGYCTKTFDCGCLIGAPACRPLSCVHGGHSNPGACHAPPPPAPLAMSAWATLRRPVQTICCLQARCAATAASCPSPAARATQWWLRAAAPACAPLMAACAPASAQVRGTVCPTGFCTHRAYYGMWSCITARHPGSPRLTQMTPEAAAEQP